jgi:hypothetical protein
LPKHHGNYNFSGVVKNLMGLIPHENRIAGFHETFYRKALQSFGGREPTPEKLAEKKMDLVLEFSRKYSERTNTDLYDKDSSLVSSAYKLWLDGVIDLESLETQLEHIANSGSLIGLKDYFKITYPNAIHILDGNYILTEHEHDGKPDYSHFTIVGNDPGFVDLAGLSKIGLAIEEIPYLITEIFNRKNDIICGDYGVCRDSVSVLQKKVTEDSLGTPIIRCVPQENWKNLLKI